MDFGNIVSVSLLRPTFTWLVLCWVQVWRCQQGRAAGMASLGQGTAGSSRPMEQMHCSPRWFVWWVGFPTSRWLVTSSTISVGRKLPYFKRTILVMLLRGQSGFHALAVSRWWSFLPHQLFPLHVLAQFSVNENPPGDFIQLWDNLANSNPRWTESLNCLVH